MVLDSIQWWTKHEDTKCAATHEHWNIVWSKIESNTLNHSPTPESPSKTILKMKSYDSLSMVAAVIYRKTSKGGRIVMKVCHEDTENSEPWTTFDIRHLIIGTRPSSPCAFKIGVAWRGPAGRKLESLGTMSNVASDFLSLFYWRFGICHGDGTDEHWTDAGSFLGGMIIISFAMINDQAIVIIS